MVADPGTFSGTPEALHYEASLENPVYVPSGLLFCPRITVGKLFGIDTIVATSGEPSNHLSQALTLRNYCIFGSVCTLGFQLLIW